MGIRRYTQAYACIRRYTQAYATCRSREARYLTGDPSDPHLILQGRRRSNPGGRVAVREATTSRGRRRGKDKKRGRKHHKRSRK